MAKRNDIPGIYALYLKTTGKWYIGQAKDITTRIKKHRWAAETDKHYKSSKAVIANAIRENGGFDNVSIVILECGDKMFDTQARLDAEQKYIEQFKSNDPNYGYNAPFTSARFPGVSKGRVQGKAERLRRSSPAYLYDTKTERTLLFLGGCKAIGKYLGFTKEKQYGKDVTSHAKKKGILFLGRYYIIPARSEERKKVCDEIHKKKVLNEDNSRRERSIKVSTRAFNEYKKVVDYIDSFSMDEFGL